MFLKLLGILFTTIAVLMLAVLLGIGLLLMLRFWFIAAIVVIFVAIMYTIACLLGLDIQFYPRY